MRRRFGILLLAFAAACGTFDEGPEQPAANQDATHAPEKKDDADFAPAPSGSADPAPATSQGGAAKAPCAVGFERDVLPVLVSSCGASSCHGEVNAPLIDAADAKATHDALMEAQFGSLEWNDPHPGFVDTADPGFKDAIDTWRMCGAPFE